MANVVALTAVLDRRADVRVAYIFGSVADGRVHTSSDVDVAIVLAERPPPRALDLLTEELEAAAGRRVDLVDLRTASPLLAHEVIRAGKCIVCRDPTERGEIEARITLKYLDTAHLRRLQDQYLHERVEARRGRAD